MLIYKHWMVAALLALGSAMAAAAVKAMVNVTAFALVRAMGRSTHEP